LFEIIYSFFVELFTTQGHVEAGSGSAVVGLEPEVNARWYCTGGQHSVGKLDPENALFPGNL
jgi:streptogramin lyase